MEIRTVSDAEAVVNKVEQRNYNDYIATIL